MFPRRFTLNITKIPSIRLSRAAAQVTVTATLNPIVFDVPSSNDIDRSTFSYNNATGDLTILKTGWYHFSFINSWVASAVGNRISVINIIDSATYTVRNDVISTVPNITLPRITEYTAKIYNINAVISFVVSQTSGGNLNVNGGVNALVASAIRLSDV